MRFDLTNEEWAIIEPLLPPTRQGGERRDDRQVADARRELDAERRLDGRPKPKPVVEGRVVASVAMPPLKNSRAARSFSRGASRR